MMTITGCRRFALNTNAKSGRACFIQWDVQRKNSLVRAYRIIIGRLGLQRGPDASFTLSGTYRVNKNMHIPTHSSYRQKTAITAREP